MTDFWQCLSKERRRLLQKRAHAQRHQTSASAHSVNGPPHALDVATLPLLNDLKNHAQVVVVVENINVAWIEALQTRWGLPSTFIARHVESPLECDPWQHAFGLPPLQRIRPTVEAVSPDALRGGQWEWAYTSHVDAVISCPPSHVLERSDQDANFVPRATSRSDGYGRNTLTRISTWNGAREGLRLYIVLLDDCRQRSSVSSDWPGPQMRMPLSNNRGGLTIPPMAGIRDFSLHDCIKSFLSHAWHFDVLFSPASELVAPEVVWYLIASSAWRTNLDHMDKAVKFISFRKIRRPTMAINNELHDLRQRNDSLHDEVAKTLTWMPPTVESSLRALQGSADRDRLHITYPSEALRDALRRSEALEAFLMKSFTLLLSSISVAEAEASARQATRAQRLTALAFLYVPLSFVTGVFGMNVKEINGSSLSIWVPVVFLVVTLVLTGLGVVGYTGWQMRLARRNAQR